MASFNPRHSHAVSARISEGACRPDCIAPHALQDQSFQHLTGRGAASPSPPADDEEEEEVHHDLLLHMLGLFCIYSIRFY